MPRTHSPYPPDFRAEAVRLARGSDKSIPALASDLGIAAEVLRHWVRQEDADAGRGAADTLTTHERDELRRLRREVEVLQQEREIVRKAAAYFAQETLCATIGSSTRSGPPIRSSSSVGCRASPARPTTPGRAAGSRPAPRLIRRCSRRSRQRTCAVAGRMARCARKRVARLLRAAGLVGCHRRRTRTTVTDPAHAPAPNLVARDFAAPAPDRLWLGDSTYVATSEGWLYLAVLVDAYSRRVIGWAMADHLRTELARDAPCGARRARRPRAGLVHHTDRGRYGIGLSSRLCGQGCVLLLLIRVEVL